MIKFLIHRPIAVIMSFLALVILGAVTLQRIPVSLLPDVQIPRVSVLLDHPPYDTRQFQEVLTERFIRQLRQCTRLKDLHAETRDGHAEITLAFEYGISTDLASIEVNDIIDRMMDQLPEDMPRPRVIKASVTDVPAFYLNVTLNKEYQAPGRFGELSEMADLVLRKRLEHIEEVAFVDLTGAAQMEVAILPEEQKLRALNIDPQSLESTFRENNLDFGAIQVEQGHYRYNVQFESDLYTVEEIRELYLDVEGKLVQLKDIATVKKRPAMAEGLFLSNGQPSISMAVIKQPDARMDELKEAVQKNLERMEAEFPQLLFQMSQDQTKLLDQTIENLGWSLLMGLLLSVLVVFTFLSSTRLPWLIALSLPVSLMITLLGFGLLGVSINVVSLSGLILGIGIMIDNSIIVIDNISQHWARTQNLATACIEGTLEVVKPLLSSTLTTTAVFVPLVFLSGVAGGFFGDQALAVSLGLGISLLVSISLLPTLYYLLNRKGSPRHLDAGRFQLMKFLEKGYQIGWKWMFRHKLASVLGFGTIAVLAILLTYSFDKEQFPAVHTTETVLEIKWNENLELATLEDRVRVLMQTVSDELEQYNAWVGLQDYFLNKTYDVKPNETSIYLRAKSEQALAAMQTKLGQMIGTLSGRATYAFSPSETIFQHAFGSELHDFELRIYPQLIHEQAEDISEWLAGVETQKEHFPGRDDALKERSRLPLETYLSLRFHADKLKLYDINLPQVASVLRAKLNGFQIGALNLSSQVVPVLVGSQQVSDLEKVLNETTVRNARGRQIPVRKLVQLSFKKGFSQLDTDMQGAFIPVGIDLAAGQKEEAEHFFSRYLKESGLPVKYAFAGQLYEAEEVLNELMGVLLVSLLLLYFILTAQFESLLQPLIILAEIPIALGGAWALLYLFGQSLNIMSGIGVIVMTGIIINDSILKIDTFNRLRREQPTLDLNTLIKLGGARRLRPVLMTSVTTILALVPFLFGSGLGAELQRPLALAIIGGLGVGTLVSLYFIPLVYWSIYRQSHQKSGAVQHALT